MLSCLKGHDITSIADNGPPAFYVFIYDNRINNMSSLYYYIKSLKLLNIVGTQAFWTYSVFNYIQIKFNAKNLFLMDFDLIDFLRNRKYGDIEIWIRSRKKYIRI